MNTLNFAPSGPEFQVYFLRDHACEKTTVEEMNALLPTRLHPNYNSPSRLRAIVEVDRGKRSDGRDRDGAR
jgi:hypothetical protein